MSEGDGRNEALFKWRTKLLQANKLPTTDITQALKLINEHLFAIPMTEQEMTASVTKVRKTDDEQRAQGQKVKLNVLEKRKHI